MVREAVAGRAGAAALASVIGSVMAAVMVAYRLVPYRSATIAGRAMVATPKPTPKAATVGGCPAWIRWATSSTPTDVTAVAWATNAAARRQKPGSASARRTARPASRTD